MVTATNNPFDQLKEYINERLSQSDKLIIDLLSKKNSTTSVDDDDIVEVLQACRITKQKRPTIYLKCRNGEMPFIKQGRKLLFSKKELNAWLQESRRPTLKEIERQSEFVPLPTQ